MASTSRPGWSAAAFCPATIGRIACARNAGSESLVKTLMLTRVKARRPQKVESPAEHIKGERDAGENNRVGTLLLASTRS